MGGPDKAAGFNFCFLSISLFITRVSSDKHSRKLPPKELETQSITGMFYFWLHVLLEASFQGFARKTWEIAMDKPQDFKVGAQWEILVINTDCSMLQKQNSRKWFSLSQETITSPFRQSNIHSIKKNTSSNKCVWDNQTTTNFYVSCMFVVFKCCPPNSYCLHKQNVKIKQIQLLRSYWLDTSGISNNYWLGIHSRYILYQIFLL